MVRKSFIYRTVRAKRTAYPLDNEVNEKRVRVFYGF